MNLVSCIENCCYQQDGWCSLPAGAPVSASVVNGCCYYTKKMPINLKTNLRNRENSQIQADKFV